ncbi:hypothetical protein D3C76_891200 [compost metagenome]
MHQQHVTGQACWRCYPLDEVKQHVIGLGLVQVGQLARIGDFVFQRNHAEGAVGLRLHAGRQAIDVATAITGQVVPDHLYPVFRNRKGVIAAVGKTGQAVTAVDAVGVHRTGLDCRINIAGQRRGAVRGVHRDLVGIGVTLEQCQLACGQFVLVLVDVGRGDDEQRLFAGKGVAQKALAVDATRRGRQATGPGRDAAVGVTGLDRAHRREAGAQLGGLVGRDLGHDRSGQQRQRQGTGLQKRFGGGEFSRLHGCIPLVALRLEVHAEAERDEVAIG